jgi:hypothetical protein
LCGPGSAGGVRSARPRQSAATARTGAQQRLDDHPSAGCSARQSAVLAPSTMKRNGATPVIGSCTTRALGPRHDLAAPHLRGEEVERRIVILAGVGSESGEDFVGSDERAFDEVRAEQPLDERGGVAARLRPGDQPVRVARVRLQRDALEVERDAGLRPGPAHAIVDLRGARGPPELALEIVPAVDALGGQVGIELVGVPAHGRQRLAGLGERRERGIEMALADVAPGADDVRDDVDDRQGRLGFHGGFRGFRPGF